MKKILLLLLLLLPGWVMADEVTPEKALEVAQRFMAQQPQTRSGAMDLELVYQDEPKTRAQQPAYYVFDNQRGKGYVVVSGEDFALPVLGYSMSANFSAQDLPVNVKWWLESYAREINYFREQGMKPTPKVREAWTRAVNVGQDVIVHETAKWNQDDPYNRQCPLLKGKRTYTGCVITATAIVMRFNQWPDVGVGMAPSYTTQGGLKVSSRNISHSFDWKKMPLKYNSYSTAEEKDEVARLMADLGVILKAEYGPNDTGAFDEDISVGLIKHMKYSKSMHLKYRDQFKTSEWLTLVKNNLDVSPMVYGGSSNDGGGHAFVFDGYSTKDYFHVNWGWGGAYDGYYLISALDPGENQGIGGSTSGFNSYQDGVFNMVKGKDADKTFQELRYYEYTDDADGKVYLGIEQAKKSKIEVGVPFFLNIGFILSTGTEAFLGDLSMQIQDREGNTKKTLWEEKNSDLDLGYLFTPMKNIRVVLDEAPSEGDVIVMCYRPSGETDWKVIRGGDTCQDAFPLTDSSAETADLEASTSLEFSKTDRILQVKVASKDIEVSVENSAHQVVDNCVSREENVAKIDSKKLAKGSYSVVLKKGTASHKFTFKVGDNK